MVYTCFSCMGWPWTFVPRMSMHDVYANGSKRYHTQLLIVSITWQVSGASVCSVAWNLCLASQLRHYVEVEQVRGWKLVKLNTKGRGDD